MFFESKIPDTTFYMHNVDPALDGGCAIDGSVGFEWDIKRASDMFAGKRVVIFGLPGAFTPTCSSQQLPRYEALYEDFKKEGIDEVYCTSVNDAFVMRAWAKDQGLVNVKMLPDGNGDFALGLGMLISKNNLGFGQRSWRYSMLVDNLVIKKMYTEDDIPMSNCPDDPFEISDADTMLEYVKHGID